MIFDFKVLINKDGKISFLVHKGPEIDELFEELVRVLDLAFPSVNILSKSKYYHITGINNTAIFATIVTLLEELYLRFADNDENLDFDLSNFDI